MSLALAAGGEFRSTGCHQRYVKVSGFRCIFSERTVSTNASFVGTKSQINWVSTHQIVSDEAPFFCFDGCLGNHFSTCKFCGDGVRSRG